MQEWNVTMIAVGAALLGCLIAIGAAIIFSRRSNRKKEKPIGTLHVAEDPDDGAYLWLELDKAVEDILPERTVTFWVDNMLYETAEAGRSQESQRL